MWTASYVLSVARAVPADLEYDAMVLARDLGDHLVSELSAAGAERVLAGQRAG